MYVNQLLDKMVDIVPSCVFHRLDESNHKLEEASCSYQVRDDVHYFDVDFKTDKIEDKFSFGVCAKAVMIYGSLATEYVDKINEKLKLLITGDNSKLVFPNVEDLSKAVKDFERIIVEG